MMKKTKKVACVLILVFFAAAGLLLFLSAGGDAAVYVTGTGKKYHTEKCSSLRHSKIAISLEDAIQSGYAPCGICRPPYLTTVPDAGNTAITGSGAPAGTASTVQPASLYRVNTANLDTSARADTARMLRAEVVQHIDGDTVRVRIPAPPAGLQAVETIRLLGVDTPETVHPNKPVQRFGKAASDFTKARLLNKDVCLAFDWDLRDRYGRLLAYIYTTDDSADPAAPNDASANCFNAELIREGYAHAYTRFAFQFADEFRALEQEARRTKQGLWGD